MLTKKQFDILDCLIDRKEKTSQRYISEMTGYSLGSINKHLKELIELGYIQENYITQQGV